MFAFALFTFQLLMSTSLAIHVVDDIPGRAASVHYSAAVLSVLPGGIWQPAFVFESTAKNKSADVRNQGYFDHLDGWTSSWVNIMLGQGSGSDDDFRLRVTRLDGTAITAATVHPARSGASVVSINGTFAEVLIPAHAVPAQFTLTLNGGMDDTDTGPSYKGVPVHTFSAFVNPYLATPVGNGVAVVDAGSSIPSDLPAGTHTLLFGPGEHRWQDKAVYWPVYTLPGRSACHCLISTR